VLDILGILHLDAGTVLQALMAFDASQRRNAGINFPAFKAVVASLTAQFKRSENTGGKYYALLSLEEAEHLRGVFHARKGAPVIPKESIPAGHNAHAAAAVAASAPTNTNGKGGAQTTADTMMAEAAGVANWFMAVSKDAAHAIEESMHARHRRGENITYVALWMLSDDKMTMLDQTERKTVPSERQQVTHPHHISMTNCYRFVNSDTHYSDSAIAVLLRVMEENPMNERLQWWIDIRATRRRRQIPIDKSMPIHHMFDSPNEYAFMAFKGHVTRVLLELQDKGMLVFDAFRAFNYSNSGALNCSELYGGMEFLGIPFTPEQIYDFMRQLSIRTEVL
jgi:hypothetical protein